MENILLDLIKEAKNQKFTLLKTKTQEAYDVISLEKIKNSQSCSELRTICLIPLTLALESKKPKLISFALVGLQLITSEEIFQDGPEPENDSLWLPAQLLNATNAILSLNEDIQIQILKTMLTMVCHNNPANCTLNGRLVILLLNRYCETFEFGSDVIKAASQAVASQTIRTYCKILQEDYEEMIETVQHGNGIKISQFSALSCFNDAIPVLQYFCNRLEESLIFSKTNSNVGYFLECLRSLFNSLPLTINKNTFFITFLWQKFCPSLLSFMGTPGNDNGNEHNLLTTNQAKIIYGIATELVRLFGNETTLRPVLEAIFHRILLLPKPEKRRESLKAVKDLISTASRLKNLLLLNTAVQDKTPIGDELSLIRLIMDSIEESSQCNDFDVILASVECIEALLGALEKLSLGESLSEDIINAINLKYKYLNDAEYKGPLTYQSMIRLPKPYRDIVANMHYSGHDSDSSGIDGGLFEPIIGECSETDDDSGADDQHDKNENRFKKSLFPEQKGILGKYDIDIEKHNARHFVTTLETILLPHLLTLRSNVQIDEIIQEFASKCCQHNATQSYETMNSVSADNIYIITISALVLNLKLMNKSHYKNHKCSDLNLIPFIDEEQFINEVQNYGISINLSKSWLSELYHKIIESSILENSGYSLNNDFALINFLIDICDLNNNRFLVDWKKLESISESIMNSNLYTTILNSEIAKVAGQKLTRKVLTCCWESMVRVLNSAMHDSSDRKSMKNFESDLKKFDQLLIVKRMKKHNRVQKIKNTIIITCLESVQKMMNLGNNLEMRNESSNFLKLISNYSIVEDLILRNREVTTSNALVLDLLIRNGLDFGSRNSNNWSLIFIGIEQVAKLENTIFTKNEFNLINLSAIQRNKKFNINSKSLIEKSEEENNNDNRIDVYGFLQSSSNVSDEVNSEPNTVAQLISELNYNEHPSYDGLTLIESAKLTSLLSAQVDEFFHLASIKFNLPTLIEFLEQLCQISQKQLFSRSNKISEEYKRWWKTDKVTITQKINTNSLFLHRIGSVTLKCMKSGRPLFHLIRIWTIVGPHFMEAACHKDKDVSRKAISCLYDSINMFINEQPLELLYFHFNEALFKPFESLLNLELCDSEIQEQIIQCVSEFAENNYSEIGSGWKSILNSLKTADSLTHSSLLLKIFQCFLNIKDLDSFNVFVIDYIMCLISHLKRRKPIKSSSNVSNNDSGSIMSLFDFQVELLKLLGKCSEIFTSLYNDNDPDGTNQDNKLFDAATMSIEFIVIDPRIESENDVLNSYAMLTTRTEIDLCNKKNIIINTNKLTNSWYVLLEELVTAMFCSTYDIQVQIIEMTIKSFRELLHCPGPNFGLYSLNTLLLPMIQGWLRQLDRFDNQTNFRLCFGQVTELYAEYFKFIHEQELIQEEENPLLTLVLKQLLLILLESFTKSNENIARLGSSCLRHLVINLGPKFCEIRWKIISVMIHRACTLSLRPLQWLLVAKNVEISPDKGFDKHVSKKRLYQIARQIFHAKLEGANCKCNINASTDNTESETCVECQSENNIYRSSIRLQLENGDKHQISFSKLLVGLLIHQILIQMLSSVLLQNLKRVIPIFDVLQINHCNLRGILNKHVTIKHIDILLKCLEISEDKSRDFNEKIHLKTMLQKSLGFELPVNLYTQTNTSEIVQIIILIELCMDGIEQCSLTITDVEKLIDFCDNISNDDYLRLIMLKLKRKWDYLCDSINEICKNDEKRQPAVQNDKITLFGNDLFELNFEKVKPNLHQKTEHEHDSDTEDNDNENDDEKMLEIHTIKFHSEKDMGHYKNCRLETIEACLELLRTLPSSRVSPLAPILGPSAQQLKTSLLNSFTNRTIYNSVNELISILKLH